MSVLLMAKVYACDLPKSTKAIALAYADSADDDGNGIYLSNSRMVWKTGFEERSVRSQTRKLEELGILVLVSQGGIGKGGVKLANEYRMIASRLPKRPPYKEWKARRAKEKEARRKEKGAKNAGVLGGISCPHDPAGNAPMTRQEMPPIHNLQPSSVSIPPTPQGGQGQIDDRFVDPLTGKRARGFRLNGMGESRNPVTGETSADDEETAVEAAMWAAMTSEPTKDLKRTVRQYATDFVANGRCASDIARTAVYLKKQGKAKITHFDIRDNLKIALAQTEKAAAASTKDLKFGDRAKFE